MKNSWAFWIIGVVVVAAAFGMFTFKPFSWLYTTGCGETGTKDMALAGQTFRVTNSGGPLDTSYHPKAILDGRCAENTDITLAANFASSGNFFVEANNGGGVSVDVVLLNSNIRELAALNIFHTSTFTIGARSGGAISVSIKDEIGQEVQLASTSQSSGDLKITVSSDKTQVTSSFLNQPVTITNTAHLGRTWVLIIQIAASADNGQGSSIRGQVNAIEVISPLGSASTTTPSGEEIISPTSEEERIEETVLPTTPVEFAAEALGITTITGIMIIVILAVLLLRKRR